MLLSCVVLFIWLCAIFWFFKEIVHGLQLLSLKCPILLSCVVLFIWLLKRIIRCYWFLIFLSFCLWLWYCVLHFLRHVGQGPVESCSLLATNMDHGDPIVDKRLLEILTVLCRWLFLCTTGWLMLVSSRSCRSLGNRLARGGWLVFPLVGQVPTGLLLRSTWPAAAVTRSYLHQLPCLGWQQRWRRRLLLSRRLSRNWAITTAYYRCSCIA